MIESTKTFAALARRARSSASSRPPNTGRLTEGGPFGPNPGALRMLVHAPDGRPPKAPLVVVLHGCGQTAEAYADGAGWVTLAERFGFALLCPEQTRSNNGNLCFNWFEPADVSRSGGEVASIAAMVRHALQAHDLDGRRVFVTGLSAGGAMAAALLATHSELFSGGAIIAGLPYGSATSMSEAFAAMNHRRPVPATVSGDAVRAAAGADASWPPVSIWHGEADTVVRPGAGDALAAQWTDVHGVSEPAVRARTPAGREFQVWLSPQGEAVVELHRIPGMGHGTPLSTTGPEGSGTAGPFLLDVGVSSSLEIAMGWGIAGAAAKPASGRPDAAFRNRPTLAASPRPRPVPERMPQPGAGGVAGVIEQALRAAGLMK